MTQASRNVLLIGVAFVAAVVIVVFAIVQLSSRSESGVGSADPATGAAADPDAVKVAFYGDSYTLGTGASDPAKRWSSIVSGQRGWSEFNPSVNGLGFVNNRSSTPPDYSADDEVSKVIADDPDILFVTMGLNDNFSMPGRADDIREAIGTDLQTLKSELPEARIIVVEPFWYTDERPDSVQQIIDWVKAGAEDIGADYIPDASHWIEGHPEWMASDGLHPNDEGYAAMAEKMDAALRGLGL
ncbi:SGNH/GDSL hydrolase family protein [Herbiconiux sp.]|uniref:SGNH/GDSL hydrolase family protein n=1 Tax=Herbiconiux sp. TaxID=1871186 RepID=UPI0025C23273|nr:SGNH/GDSL hydrolase family protein [Herbiconiux sp.]